MKKLLFTVTFMLLALMALANGNKLDSLKTALFEAPNQLETGRINYLIAHNLKATAPNEASPYVANAIIDFKAIDDHQRTGKAYYLAGFIEERLHNDKQAAKNYLYASKHLEDADDKKNLVKSYVAIGYQAMRANDLIKANNYLLMALSTSKDEVGINDLGLAYLYLGDVNRMQGNHKEALDAYTEAKILLKKNFKVRLGLTATMIDLGRFEEAEGLLKVLEAATPQEQGFDYWAVQAEKLRYLQFKGKNADALALADKLITNTGHFTDLQATVLFARWGLYQQMDAPPQALQAASALVAYAQAHHLNNHLLNYLPVLANYAGSVQAYALANQWHRLYQQLQKTVVAPRQAQQEAIKLDLALAEHAFEAELRQAAVEAQLRQDTFMYYLNAVIFIMLLVLGYKVYRRTKRYQQMFSIVLRAYKDDPNLTQATLKSVFTPGEGSMYRDKEKARQVTEKLKKERRL